MWVNSEIARMSQASIHGLYHAVVFLCVRDRLRVKPQGDGEYQRGVWNAESSPDCVHTDSHSHTHTHTHTHRDTRTQTEKGRSGRTKQSFDGYQWMHSLTPVIQNSQSPHHGLQTSCQLYQYLHCWSFLLTFFSIQETGVWSCSQKITKTYSWCDFPSLNHSNQILLHSGSVSVPLSAQPEWLGFVDHVPVQECFFL